MTTLIEFRNSQGVIGRCDAKCYQATSPHCECICGGSNHGAGLEKAIDNTRELAEDWIAAWKAKHPGASDFEVPDSVRQLGMFEGATP